jgi:hypothetical protein
MGVPVKTQVFLYTKRLLSLSDINQHLGIAVLDVCLDAEGR